MNKIFLIGRLTRDAEIRYTQGNDPLEIASFDIAVDRRVKNGDATADFFSCRAFGKTAEIIEKYTSKGSQIGISGRLQNNNYTNRDGQKVYGNVIVVEEIQLLGKKEDSASTTENKSSDDGFMNIPEGIDEELPFN